MNLLRNVPFADEARNASHTDRSVYISRQALPLLRQELLQLKGSSIQLVSGATDTSYAFVEAVRGALTKAGV